MKKYIVFLFLIVIFRGIAQEKEESWMFNLPMKLNRNGFENFWKDSKQIIFRDKIDSTLFWAKADSVLNTCVEDSTRLTEIVKIYRGALDLFTIEDPHFRIYPQFIRNANNPEAKKNSYGRYIMVLPFNLLQIEDSLLVNKSLSNKILKGDLILSVNGKSAKKILDYTYRDRYINSITMQLQNDMMFYPNYDLELIRNGKNIKTKVSGVSLNEYRNLLVNTENITSKILGQDIGYFEIKKFEKNKKIIKKLRKLIEEIRVIGGNSIIIDIRKNGGGSGNDFDKLISIFTPKKEIDYLKDAKILVTEKTSLENGVIGDVISLPNAKVLKKIPLKPNLYMGKMNYYILMSINTDSIASSFANIMQYNTFGTLVGEPMRYNATKYGDVIEQNSEFRLIHSTVEYDEYTKAVNGIVKPDISIPFIAEEYAKGGDPILEELIKIIKKKENGKVNLE